MRIGCLQFGPRLGEVDSNLNDADEILNAANPEDLDLLVLPELAFSGYNFKSLQEIYPFLEPTATGITSVWARNAALRHDCAVAVGYPETADVSHKWPTSPEYYNSLIVVNRDGDTWAHYRKSHLYYTDESWALEGDGFWKGFMPGIGKIALGICMDINPYKFEAPWDQFEFATHALEVAANVIILSMAWLTREDPHTFTTQPAEPDMETLTYWVKRMEPLIRADDGHEVIVIFSNRSGIEGDATYAGTSAVLGIQNGEVTVYGLLGRGEKQLLVVDTSKPGFAKMVYRPDDEAQSDISQEDTHSNQEMSDNGSDTNHSSRSREANGLNSESSGNNTPWHTAQRPGSHFSQHQELSKEFWGNSHPQSFSERPPSPTFSLQSPREIDGIPRQSLSSADEAELSSDYLKDQASTAADDAEDLRFVGIDPEPTVEFSDLVKALQDSGPARDAYVARPFSTKSRNASRVQSRTTNHANTIEHPGHEISHHTFSPTRDFEPAIVAGSTGQQISSRLQPEDIDDRKIQWPAASRNPAVSRCKVHPEEDRLDMEKIGADLMIFEEETAKRTKRQSLICHVDDDDYIVLRTVRKDGNPGGYKPPKPDCFPDRPSSRQTPRNRGSAGHTSRSHSRNTQFTGPCTPAEQSRSSRSRSASRGESGFILKSPPQTTKKVSSLDHYTSKTTSSPSSRSCQPAHRGRLHHVGYSSQDHIVEHQILVTNPYSGHRTGESHYNPDDTRAASLEDPIVFSPQEIIDFSPDMYYTAAMEPTASKMGGKTAEPRAGRAPLTPKAMRLIVEPDGQPGTFAPVKLAMEA